MATIRTITRLAATARSIHSFPALSSFTAATHRGVFESYLHSSSTCNYISSPNPQLFSHTRLSGVVNRCAVHGGDKRFFSSAVVENKIGDDVVLYQYEACPFCNKVKAFLDFSNVPYKIVEVNPISKKEIKWSDYKKVPILMVDGEQMVDSSEIIDKLFKKVHPQSSDAHLDDEEVKKWRGWVDSHLVHVLSPNIYRTPSEALESFDYITTHGNFNFTERLIGKYAGAAAMYFVSKKLKKKHNITDARGALYEAAETWVKALQGKQYLGGSEPTLADLAVFGVLRPIRYLKSGKDMVENTSIGEWYTRLESEVKRRRGMKVEAA